MKNVVILIGLILTLSSCSPFGEQSLISDISKTIERLTNSKTNVEFVSGGSQTIETNPGVPSLNYKVTLTVGNHMNQPTIETVDGYKVYSTIQAEDIQ